MHARVGNRWRASWLVASLAFLACFACLSLSAQSTQFLPEVDANLTVNSYFRTYLQAKDDREGGDPTQFTFGPSVQLYLKPLVKLKKVTAFDLDDAKARPLVLESGYRIITQPNQPNENRALEAVTLHFPIWGDILITDRNRADLDWKNGVFTWRYRNRLDLERTFAVHSYHLIPYLAAEPFYESQYHKWSATDLYAGVLLPVGKHVEFNPYYEFENNTAKKPNQQNYYVGLAVYFFFSVASH
ncbi:MAG TPA: DUF2490 domain-containing protein [Candidatus Sulfotelmatobacter sp.]|nr:DUF2490 domain-containing protein [Candidatus Sulfotelmatobacter sp.]